MSFSAKYLLKSLLTLIITGPHRANPNFSNVNDDERSCCGGVGLGGLKLVLIPQVARRIKGILVRDIPV